jgi:hypothetical protein
VCKNHGSYVSIVLDEHGMLTEVHAKRSAETGEIKIVPPQMLIGWLLDMAVGSQDTPKGTHASEIHARAAQPQEAASACGKRSGMKRKKGQFGCGAYADEPWSLQAYQKRVYAVSAQRAARSRAASCTEALTMALTRGAAVRPPSVRAWSHAVGDGAEQQRRASARQTPSSKHGCVRSTGGGGGSCRARGWMACGRVRFGRRSSGGGGGGGRLCGGRADAHDGHGDCAVQACGRMYAGRCARARVGWI